MSKNKFYIIFLILTTMPITRIFAAKNTKDETQVIYYEGKAEAKRAQKEEWENVKLKMMLYPKDRVRTKLQSKVELKLPDNSIFNIGENTTFDIQKLFTDNTSGAKNYSFKLFVGDMVGNIEKLKKGDTFEIETPVALVGFRGTTVFIHVEPNGETWIGMRRGSGYIRSIKTGGEQVIEENFYFLLGTDGAFIGSGVLSGSDIDRFKNLEKIKGELIKKGEVTPPKIISVEKDKNLASIKGQSDPASTIYLVSSSGQSLTTAADENGNFTFKINFGEDTSPPVIKITTSEFGKKATNKRNLKIVGLVVDKFAAGVLNLTFTSMNKDGEKSMQTPYKLDVSKEGLKFFINGEESDVNAGVISTTYMLNEGRNVLEFRAVDGAGNEARETKIIYLDTMPPKILNFNVTPYNIKLEDTVEISIEAQDEVSEMKKNTLLTLTHPKGASFQLNMPYDYTLKRYTARLTPGEFVKNDQFLTRRAEGQWKISAEPEDELGNKTPKRFGYFNVIDLPPPPPDK
ncbi:MAG: FecR domain-containing protein [bacterium]